MREAICYNAGFIAPSGYVAAIRASLMADRKEKRDGSGIIHSRLVPDIIYPGSLPRRNRRAGLQ
jgi:hypothetical protein